MDLIVTLSDRPLATMHSSKYSYVSKHTPMVQKKMQYHSQGKSCGYYLRILFFFSSLIQSLIIVSLVLFLIYGDRQDSESLSHMQDLDKRFSQLSMENLALKSQRKNLTMLLNATLTEKAQNDWDLSRLRYYSNISIFLIRDIDKAMVRHQLLSEHASTSFFTFCTKINFFCLY